jgi:hypothetical protein
VHRTQRTLSRLRDLGAKTGLFCGSTDHGPSRTGNDLMSAMTQHVTQFRSSETAVLSAHWTHGHLSIYRCCERSSPRSRSKHNVVCAAPPLRRFDNHSAFTALSDAQQALTVFYLSTVRKGSLE